MAVGSQKPRALVRTPDLEPLYTRYIPTKYHMPSRGPWNRPTSIRITAHNNGPWDSGTPASGSGIRVGLAGSVPKRDAFREFGCGSFRKLGGSYFGGLCNKPHYSFGVHVRAHDFWETQCCVFVLRTPIQPCLHERS